MNQIQIISTTPEELTNFINEGLRAELENLKKEFKPNFPEEFLTRHETAKLLKISHTTLWDWTKKGKLRTWGLQGKVYYKRSEVESALIALND